MTAVQHVGMRPPLNVLNSLKDAIVLLMYSIYPKTLPSSNQVSAS